MGAVYEAVNTALGKRAAVKVIAEDLAQRADVVERFRREARTIAAIDDPNVVDIFDLNEIEGVGRSSSSLASGSPRSATATYQPASDRRDPGVPRPSPASASADGHGRRDRDRIAGMGELHDMRQLALLALRAGRW